MEAAFLLVVAFLLPLRLAGSGCGGGVRSAAAVLTIAALLSNTGAISDSGAHPAEMAEERQPMRSEIDELKLKIARLESILEQNSKSLSSKASSLEEDNKLIEAMECDIQSLINEKENIKRSQSNIYPEGHIKDMEDELQLLKEDLTKINSDVDAVESLANHAEKRVEALSSEVKKLENVVMEQWIQVRQFEQAFQLTMMMTSKVHKRSRSMDTSYKWPGKDVVAGVLKLMQNIRRQYNNEIESDLPDSFLLGGSISRSCISQIHKQFKGVLLVVQRNFHEGISFTRSCISQAYIQCKKVMETVHGCYHEVSRLARALCHHYIPDIDLPNVFFLGGSVSRSCISLANNQFKTAISAAHKCHHEVQVFLKDAMRSNKYSEGLANERVTFCLAYIVVISPMWIAWLLYSMRFYSER